MSIPKMNPIHQLNFAESLEKLAADIRSGDVFVGDVQVYITQPEYIRFAGESQQRMPPQWLETSFTFQMYRFTKGELDD